MYVGKDGRVAGSIDRAQVAELLSATDDDELKAYYRDLLGESDEAAEYDNPTDDEAEATGDAEPPPADEDLDALRARAEELGVKVDGRWGADRLKSEIAAAEEQEG